MKHLICLLFGHRRAEVTPWNDAVLFESCRRCGKRRDWRKGTLPRCLP